VEAADFDLTKRSPQISTMTAWLLVMAFVVVIGAVVGAVTSEMYGDRIDRLARKRVREPAG
jgi:hypothetical protein